MYRVDGCKSTQWSSMSLLIKENRHMCRLDLALNRSTLETHGFLIKKKNMSRLISC
jgi:hypothetical protein